MVDGIRDVEQVFILRIDMQGEVTLSMARGINNPNAWENLFIWFNDLYLIFQRRNNLASKISPVAL